MQEEIRVVLHRADPWDDIVFNIAYSGNQGYLLTGLSLDINDENIMHFPFSLTKDHYVRWEPHSEEEEREYDT